MVVAGAPSQPVAQPRAEVVIVGVIEVARSPGEGVVGQRAHAGRHRGQRGQGGEVVDGEVRSPAQGQRGGGGVVVADSAHLVVQVGVEVAVGSRPGLTSLTMT